MLQKFIPRSLQAQLIILILGVVLLVQAATFATVSLSWRQFTQGVAVDLTVTTLRTLRNSLKLIPSNMQSEFVRHASGNQWRLWSRTLPSHTRIERHRQARQQASNNKHELPRNVKRMLASFIQTLNNELDDGTRVALSHGSNPRLFVSLNNKSDNKSHVDWLVIPIDRIAPHIKTPTIVFWLLGMGTLLILSAAFSWYITIPLRKLAKAADQLAAGKPQRVVPSGPSETRILGERFNIMLDTLAEADEVQRTLLAGLPHDLKGPLSRMWLRIEMLDDQAFQDGMRNDLQDMQRMVDQFISFLRGSDPDSYKFEQLSLNEWITNKVNSWQTTGCDISLEINSNTDLQAKGDELSLNRMVDNLISNSLQHGKEPINITLAHKGKNAMLTISDSGCGIDEKDHAQALRPFSKLDEARTKTGSVGLGLALADSIAKSHKGKLELISGNQTGLKVEITLPIEN